MADFQIARRYASALFEIACEHDIQEEVWQDLQSLAILIEQSPELADVIVNPLLGIDRKSALLDSLFKGKINTLSYQFILFLEEKRRINLIAACCQAIDELYHDYKGIIRVNIISAIAMEPNQIAEIKKVLQNKFEKDIESQQHVDPSLLGGFKLIIGDKVIDFSLLSQLNRIKKRIINA